MSFGQITSLMYVVVAVAFKVERNPAVEVPHMIYDVGRWVKGSPRNHRTIRIEVSIAADRYHTMKATPPPAVRRRTADMNTVADTCCQVCCMGLRQMNMLGVTENDLPLPTLCLKAANSTGMKVIGATFVQLIGRTSSGHKTVSRQVCCVAEGLDHLLLSGESCIGLGIISEKFPFVSECSNLEVSTELPSPCKPNKGGKCSSPAQTPEPDNDMKFIMTINLFMRLSFTNLMNLIIGMNCITAMGI